MAAAESGDAVNSLSQNVEKSNVSDPHGKSYMAIMDYSLFFEAVIGNTEAFEQHKHRLDQLVTSNDDSILHICITALPFPNRKNPFINYLEEWAAKSCLDLVWKQKEKRYTKFIKLAEWVAESCPDLLRKQNKKRDTALHMAARHGHLDIAIKLVQLCEGSPENNQERGVVGAAAVREMIAMKNEDEDTALHEALKLSNVYDQDKLNELVKLLTQERNISYEPNKHDETPLYLAAERGVGTAIVDVILNSQPPPAHSGPNGRNALHAAVIRNNMDFTSTILTDGDKVQALINEQDRKGWVPLHYAAYFGYSVIVQLLLEVDRSVAFTPTNDETKMLPLHLAASSGQVEVMDAIINLCPGCCELVDQRKWNVFHFAVDSENEKAVIWVLKHPFLKNLINKKNNQGSTPLHMLADSVSFVRSFVTHPQVDKLAFNGRNLNVLDLLLSADGLWGQRKRFADCLRKELKVEEGRRIPNRKDEEEGSDTENKGDAGTVQRKSSDDIMDYIKDAREAHLVVATLIATVTFAAGFTLPGGYKDEGGLDEGGAILTRRTTFQAFIIADTIAMLLSSAAVLVHLFIPLDKDKTRVYSFFKLVPWLTLAALVAMVVAFITGTYSVLLHNSSLAIATCVLGCLFFLFQSSILVAKLPDKHRKKRPNLLVTSTSKSGEAAHTFTTNELNEAVRYRYHYAINAENPSACSIQ